jgi:hypothetical protein
LKIYHLVNSKVVGMAPDVFALGCTFLGLSCEGIYRFLSYEIIALTTRSNIFCYENALAAWRSGHHSHLRNRGPGFESRQGIRF